MPIDPATGEEAEDLTKVEWGAGLARMMRGQIPNMLFVGLGFSCLVRPPCPHPTTTARQVCADANALTQPQALPSYLATGWNETHLSNGTEIVFPIGMYTPLLASAP